MAARPHEAVRDALERDPRHRQHQIDARRAEPDDDDPRRGHGEAGGVVLLDD